MEFLQFNQKCLNSLYQFNTYFRRLNKMKKFYNQIHQSSISKDSYLSISSKQIELTSNIRKFIELKVKEEELLTQFSNETAKTIIKPKNIVININESIKIEEININYNENYVIDRISQFFTFNNKIQGLDNLYFSLFSKNFLKKIPLLRDDLKSDLNLFIFLLNFNDNNVIKSRIRQFYLIFKSFELMNNYSKLIASQKVQNKNSKYFLLREISNFQNNTLKSPYLFYLQYRKGSESILHLKNLKSNDKWTINFYARNSECNIDCEQFKGNIFVLGGWFDNVLKTGCRIDLT